MIRVVKAHNRLNGLRFSTVEFALVAAIASPFAVYYAVHGDLSLAAVAWGIILNCLTVVAFGLRAWLRWDGGDGQGGTIWDREARDRLRRESPHMLRDTLLLTGATIVPFLLLALILAEELMSRLARRT